MLTNFREPLGPNDVFPSSRGEIIPDFLSSDEPAHTFVEQLAARDAEYGGYNFVCGSLSEQLLWFKSNRGGGDGAAQPLGRGLHSVSNGRLHDEWPKRMRGVELLEPLLNGVGSSGGGLPVDQLFEVMSGNEVVTDSSKLERTGIAEEHERKMSSMFVEDFEYKGKQYGTRSQSVIAITRSGHVLWSERTRDHATADWSGEHFEFDLDAAQPHRDDL